VGYTPILLGVGYRMKKKHQKHVHSVLYYAPRILALVVGLFFLLMLFDLEPGFSVWEFLWVLLPGLIVILAAIVTWNKPRRASLLFAILTVIYTLIGFVFIQDGVIGVVTVPLIIVSALFILNAKSHMFV